MMKRDLRQLSSNTYDLLVIGGGIYGACVAWDATLRGLSVALVERADFCSATSANSSKIIHGGLRYLQHADWGRMRESIRERRTMMAIAPHLVHPLPVVVPTYGHGTRGKEAMRLALAANDLISLDRNRLRDPEKHIPRGRVVSRQECLQLLPGVPQAGLTGGAVFHDAHMHNSERLVLAFLRSADRAGAHLANYIAAIGFLREGDHVTGVEAEDALTGDRFDIRARAVVNAAGPWVDAVLGLLDGQRIQLKVRFARAVNLVTRSLFGEYAVGLYTQSSYRDADALVNRGSRLLFFVPWRGRSLVGTTYDVYDRDPDALTVTEEGVQGFLQEINQAYPPAGLGADDVSFVHWGLLPISEAAGANGQVRLTKHYQISDHRRDGLAGLISIVGVKFTTARHVAERVVDSVFALWDKSPPRSATANTPLHGGQIEQFDAYLRAEVEARPEGLAEESISRLVHNYGSAYRDVLCYLDAPARRDAAPHDPLAVLGAETLHGVREEMAQRLADIVFRRTDLGTAGPPGDEGLRFCAEVMGAELGWSRSRIEQERRGVEEAARGMPRAQAAWR